MDTILYCKDPKEKGCSWSGGHDELVALTDDSTDIAFDYCPNCEGDDFDEEDIEDDDEEDDDE